MCRNYKCAPFPFMGQKRYFLRDFTEVLQQVEGEIDTVVDLFGGSGLLSHTAKRVLPGCRVVYNDFDLWFFNGATGCPNFMVDRYTETSPTPIVAEANLDAAITSRLQDEPVLLLDMKAGFDITNDSRLVVEGCGTKFSRDPICDEPYITLWLTENNVAAKNQQGSSGNFKHQHVTRALNSTWGQPVLFEGDNFEYTYVFEDVDPSWKTADLVVVGAVHEKKGTNRTGMAVANACFKGYDDFEAMSAPSGADRVAVEGAQAEEEYYTLAGLRVSPENLAPGLYIRRCGEKTEKVLVR